MIQMPDSIEELAENPTKYGMPTIEEFCKNKEKYMGRYDDEITAIDRGDPALGLRQKYYVESYRVDSLEQAERIALDMGLSLHHDFIVDPQIQDDDGMYTRVTFRSKQGIEKRANW